MQLKWLDYDKIMGIRSSTWPVGDNRFLLWDSSLWNSPL